MAFWLNNILIEFHHNIKTLSLGIDGVAERGDMLPFVKLLVDVFETAMQILPQMLAYIGIIEDRADGVGSDHEDVKGLFHCRLIFFSIE